MEPLVEGKDYILINGVLKINEGIKYIPGFLFSRCDYIYRIIFPSTLTTIGYAAFSNLTYNGGEIVIPDSVKYIQEYAFSNCKFSNLTIGANVEYIGSGAFNSCNLNKVTNLSTKLKYIGSEAFLNNDRMEIFEINNYGVLLGRRAISLKTLEKYSNYDKGTELYNENLRKNLLFSERAVYYESSSKCASYVYTNAYKYENGILKINDGVEVLLEFNSVMNLKDCKSIEMPDSVLIIDSYAFRGMKELESIKFSNNLLLINDGAFKDSVKLGKNKLVLPDSLRSLARNAFSREYGPNKISILYDTSVILNDKDNDIFEIRSMNNFIDTPKYVFDVNDLLANDKKKLKKLGLLPETIRINTMHSVGISPEQEEILKDALTRYIMCDSYNEKNNIEDIRKLLDINGIDLTNEDNLINCLFNKNQKKTIYLFISYGYNCLNNSMIARAILNNMYDMIEVLLLLGVHIDEIGTIETTPLSIASQIGNTDLVKYLIENGASLNKVDYNNKTAIDYARENGHDEIVELLNDYNSNVSEAQRDLDSITKLLKQ